MKTQRKPIPRLSEKKAKSGKPFLKRSAIKRKHRKPSEFKRIYGSKERVEFVKSLPCAACGIEGFSVCAHLTPKGEKGTGYKGDARFIVPLCCNRWKMPYSGGRIDGCHTLYDEYRSTFTQLFPGFDPSTEASRTEKMWRELQDQEHLG